MCALRARLRPCRGRRPERGRGRRPCEGVARSRGDFLRHDEGRRAQGEPDHDPLGRVEADDDRPPRRHRPCRRRRGGRRRPGHARPLSRPRSVDHRVVEQTGRLRRLGRPRGAHVPAGQGLHHRQRAEQVSLLAAAVQPEREGSGLPGLRNAARRLVRRVEGRRPQHPGDRRRAGPARDRQPARGRQPLDLAGALHPGYGSRVPSQQADEADHGRAQLSPAPEPRDGQARNGLSLAERRDPESRADQAGRLGRFQQDGPADVPGGRHARWPPAHAQAEAERGRLAGRDSGGLARRVLRQGERRHDRRGQPGGDLREPDPAPRAATRP